MIWLVPFFVLVLIVVVARARRARKARSAVGPDGFAPFVVLSIDDGRVRHRAPATRRGFAGSRGSM